MNNIKFLVLAFFLCFISACSDKVERVIKGQWIIEEIVFNNEDVLSVLDMNAVFFSEDNSCQLPVNSSIPDDYSNPQIYLLKMKGKWFYQRDDEGYKMKIETNNSMFNGDFKIRFEKDSINIFSMILLSKNLYVRCKRSFSLLDRHQEVYKEIIEPW